MPDVDAYNAMFPVLQGQLLSTLITAFMIAAVRLLFGQLSRS